MQFRYMQLRSPRPVISLAGRVSRPRAIIGVALIGPAGTMPQDALLDSGADDTVFPEAVAARLGLDLTNAPTGTIQSIGGVITVRYAEVTLRVADNQERREWKALVGFSSRMPRYPMLGFAGFLQYFTATFHGDREEVEPTVNGLYPGI
jgi:hypothetical protein